jgi:hypothetical protein
MDVAAFWRWFDRAARADFAGNAVGWFWDWKSWTLSAVGGALALILSKLDGWSNTSVFLATLCAGLIVAIVYAILKWVFSFAPTGKPETPHQSALATASAPPSVPDIDAREAFFQILEKSEWSVKQQANLPDPKTTRSDWLKVRLSMEIHNYLAQDRLTAWGETSLPRGTGPQRKIKPEEWEQSEIVFDAVNPAIPRTMAKWRSNDRGSLFGIMFSAAQIFQLFPLVSQANDWRPIHLGIKYVSERIRDADVSKCWPSARQKMRQAAYDKTVQIRGRKQLPNKRMTRGGDYADIHTDIDGSYWTTTEINALATSPNHQTDYHTDPETAYAWGPKGMDERNRYAELL